MVGWSVLVLGGPSINDMLRAWNQLKWSKGGHWNPCLTSAQVQTDTWYQWIVCRSSFIPKYFLQNLKNPLVAKRTIHGGTLGRPVDSWVAFGDRVTIFQQHCFMYLVWRPKFIAPHKLCLIQGGWSRHQLKRHCCVWTKEDTFLDALTVTFTNILSVDLMEL